MKSKLAIFITAIFLSVWSLSVKAQTNIPNGKVQLTEFTNTTARFTVPAGKTWYISNIFSSSQSAKEETNYIILKNINNTTFGSNGPILSNFARNFINYPIIFPEKTTFEIQITDLSAKAIIIYTEVDN